MAVAVKRMAKEPPRRHIHCTTRRRASGLPVPVPDSCRKRDHRSERICRRASLKRWNRATDRR